ncbi:NADH-quinone oxidoreductase subunit E [Ponticoccus sp. SC2-23]|uniref:NADH-quinone oxidoreductase subunit E n=1 Tax=Alexandriicola marinus TaxID=2081710 RepID=UPI000FD7509D|nr:NADH-quinone oxidoreductase subunit E [Alexandriicola marinus]MBM1219414.1 NADH-quinone oxidoreductase subunit E [Ponticoccus sp. SC6-9]MBM1223514.1 NADH-quinone oxidoreductase subunit E [Ponticoccus sp. SC6-15]MBM1229227.1 NADH-quinone oxidoreductase subunit E [Ponticoccus sp. SC6-38]MBM1232480.1 NADH-quinone oxidoreductase subunit E [Ponticoccus sp. SC6-45]MBM1237570.1 NADH-quinone oxidoreductase subunit E [Ponticoccus sp. SC6-49]MBM1241491.1 NADH-quinone oxidoreductase subunit E [Pontic
MLRRLHADQPDSFAFTPDNEAWARAQIAKYPEGRQASAIIPLLWRAQEQEGWLSRPAIEHVASMLDLAYIRALEVATFYFMFQLKPVGSVANVQICGTLSCMICGAEDLVGLCKEKIAAKPHTLSADGKFSWEEVECLGACSNAPMAQIGKDYYEDLTVESLGRILDEMAEGKVPTPGPQNGRYASEPASGLTSLTEWESDKLPANASVTLATEVGDTLKRIDGTEVPLVAPWTGPNAGEMARANASAHGDPVQHAAEPAAREKAPRPAPEPAATEMPKPAKPAPSAAEPAAPVTESEPARLDSPKGGTADDLKRITGVGPKLEGVLNELGFWHFDQIAQWGPAEVEWVDARLKFKGRITRDDWIAQARKLASEG